MFQVHVPIAEISLICPDFWFNKLPHTTGTTHIEGQIMGHLFRVIVAHARNIINSINGVKIVFFSSQLEVVAE